MLQGCSLIETLSRPIAALCDAPIYVVTKTEDTNDGVCTPDDCSLREAIITANVCLGAEQTIQLRAGTYVLGIAGVDENDAATGDLDITGDLILVGEGSGIDGLAEATIIDGGELDRVLDILTGARVRVEHLAIRNGRGGISNRGSLELLDVAVRDNHAPTDSAISNLGAVEMSGVLVAFNVANPGSSRARGAAINNMGSMTITGTEVMGNTVNQTDVEIPGQSIAVENSGALEMTDTLIHDNNDVNDIGLAVSNKAAYYGGGGGPPTSIGVATLTRVTIYGHTGWAVVNSQDDNRLTLIDSTLRDNAGGAIANYNRGFATIRRTTINGNGGGRDAPTGLCSTVLNLGTMRLENATLSGNLEDAPTCTLVTNVGDLALNHVTLYGNRGRALEAVAYADALLGFAYSSESLLTTLRGSLFFANDGETCGGRAIDSLGHNLLPDVSCAPRTGLGDLVLADGDPLILPLMENGGPTRTHALGEGSPAIDAAGPSCPAEDQRSAPRPVGGGCDIGAFEASFALVGGRATTTPDTIRWVRPNQPATCRFGPGIVYHPVIYLAVGQQLYVQGRNADGSWLEIQGPDGDNCWINRRLLDLDPALDLPGLPMGIIPPTPTSTPVPPTETPVLGCVYQGLNDPQPKCYVPCPVPGQFPECSP